MKHFPKLIISSVLSVFFVIILSVLFLTACGGSSGSSDEPETVSAVFSTTIEMGGAASGVSLFSAASFASPAAAQNIEVRLYLPDGSSFVMEKTSAAGHEYTAQIEYPEGASVYIEALVDNIVLKNFFDSVTVNNNNVALGGTTPLTTLFVDILEEVGNTNIKSAFSSSSSLNFDVNVTTVRTNVLNTGNTEFLTLRNAYTGGLTWENTQNNVSAQLVQAVKEYAVQEGFDFENNGGGTLTEQQEAKAFAVEFMSKVFNGQPFASLVYADGFLSGGQSAEEFIANTTDEFAGQTINLLSNDPRVEKVSDGLYKFFIKARIQFLENNVVVAENGSDDYLAQDMSGLVKKINGSWYFIGDQEKVWYRIERSVDFLYLMVEEHGSYPVSSVTADSASLDFNRAMTKEGGRWNIQIADRSVSRSFDGQNVRVTVTYADGSTSQKIFTIPAWVEKTVSINSATKNGDGTVTVNYSVPTSDSNSAEIFINDFSLRDLLWGNNKSVTLPASAFRSGTNNIYLYYYDVYHRQYGIHSSVNY